MRVLSIILLLILGCVSRPTAGTGSVPVPSDVPRDSINNKEIFPPSIWREYQFNVAMRVHTAQDDSAAADTLIRNAVVTVVPQIVDSTTVLLFQADAQPGDTSTVETIGRGQIRVDARGNSSIVKDSTEICSARLPEVSPILIRQLIYPAGPDVLHPGSSFTDSLKYSSCIQGVRVHSTIEIQWTRASTQVDDGVRLSARLQGRIHADSSRQLPMTLTGIIAGTSSLLFEQQTLELKDLRFEVTSQLNAQAKGRHQHFTQLVLYHVVAGR